MSAYSEILDSIKTTSDTSIEAVRATMVVMAKMTLGPLEEDHLLRLLSQQTGKGLTPLRQEFAQLCTEHGIPPNDLGIAIAKEVLESQFNKGRELIRVTGMGYYHYNGTHWQEYDHHLLRKRVLPIVSQFKPHFGKRPVTSVVSEVLTCIGDLVAIFNPKDTPKNVINTTTGEIWLKSDGSYEFKPHNPDSRLFSCLPYGNVPKAKAPLYTTTMQEIFKPCSQPDEMVRHWNEFLGYVIQPDRFVASIWFMIGGGSNGKSTALKVLLKLLGPLAHCCDIKGFSNDSFKYRALFNKWLLVDDDSAKAHVLDDAFLKKISEDGWHTARSPHKLDNITFQNTAAALFVGNHYPQCHDVSYGMRRRLHVFPFDRLFEPHEADVERFKKIEADEMPGVLALALEGYKRICQRGRKFDVPEDSCQHPTRYRTNDKGLVSIKEVVGKHIVFRYSETLAQFLIGGRPLGLNEDRITQTILYRAT
jgi:putative DNA primase/helicase